MKVNELLKDFEIFITNEERKLLPKLQSVSLLSSFSERDQVVIENLIRKSVVIKIGHQNPKVVANEDIGRTR